MAITYMQRRKSGIYEFRRMLPTVLAGKLAPDFMREPLAELINPKTGCFKRELTVSLATKDPKEAKRRDLREATRVTEVFSRAERMAKEGPLRERPAVTTVDLAELEARVVAGWLEWEEAQREGDDRRHLLTAEERAHWPDLAPVPGSTARHMTEDHFIAHGMYLEEEAASYRQALARRDISAVREWELQELLNHQGITVDPAAPWYRDACLAVVHGNVKALDLMLKRQQGEDVPTPEVVSSAKGPRLAETFELWKSGNAAKGAKKPSPGTILEANHAVRRFKELHGDIRLGEITKEKARVFRDTLAKVPTRLKAHHRAMTIQEVLRAPDIKELPAPYAGTVNKSMTLLSAIVSYAEREALVEKVQGFANPFKGLNLPVDEREVEGRKPFTPADLRAIFAMPVYRDHYRPEGGAGEAAFWLPLISLLSGARLGEMAQLRIGDLQENPENGLWYFDISTEGGRTIKTATSRRDLPVHPHLIKVGLTRYHQDLIDRGLPLSASLWPDLKSDTVGRPAGPWSKWFNRYMGKHAGVDEPGKVFHSFRHTFKRLSRSAGILEEVHDALTGHSGGGVGRSYGDGFELPVLAAAMGTIETPEAVRGLEWRP